MDIMKFSHSFCKSLKMLFIFLIFLYAIYSPWFYSRVDPQRYYQLALALLMLALLFELRLVNLRFADFIRQPIRWRSATGFLYLSALLCLGWGLWGI